jgi:hypothetical protein
MTHTNQTALDLDLDQLEALARSGEYITRTEKLGLIELARRAQPSPAQCVICGADEPRTGTCGSDDPRALCKLPASAAGAGSEHVGVRPWEQRLNAIDPAFRVSTADAAKDAEIAELRAALTSPSSSASEHPAVVCKSCTSSDVVIKNSGNLNINGASEQMPPLPEGDKAYIYTSDLIVVPLDEVRAYGEACARYGWDSCATSNQELIRQLRDQITRAAHQAATNDTARLNAMIDWLLRGGLRLEISPNGHMERTTREQVIAYLDASIAATTAKGGAA